MSPHKVVWAVSRFALFPMSGRFSPAVIWRSIAAMCESREPEFKCMIKQPLVYILASARNGTLYIGVTSDLVKRIWEHKNNLVEGFSKRYGVHQLVWYELHENMESAINREKHPRDGRTGGGGGPAGGGDGRGGNLYQRRRLPRRRNEERQDLFVTRFY